MLRAALRARGSPRQLPKQYGGFSERLHPHITYIPDTAAVNRIGAQFDPPDSSHQGWFTLKPQLHHTYS
jgi:hypothetical protein